MSSAKIEVVTQAALSFKKSGDGRLGAILDRSIKHVRDEYPGQMTQVGKSKTVRAQIDKLIWDHAESRVLRFLASNKINLKLV